MSWNFKITGRTKEDLAAAVDKGFHEARHGVRETEEGTGAIFVKVPDPKLNEPTHRALDLHVRMARSIVATQDPDRPLAVTLESSGHIEPDGTGTSVLTITRSA